MNIVQYETVPNLMPALMEELVIMYISDNFAGAISKVVYFKWLLSI